MKKLLLLSLSALLLSGCSDKKQFEQAVLDQMQLEKDVKDYKLSPERMAKCVVDTTSNRMPGIFALDPKRLTAYRNYTKWLTLSSSQDPKKTIDELNKDFGSPKEFAEARANYTESQMDCLSALIGESEEPTKDEK
ncbi:hypothetical protein [Candidatus Methylobacter oryzae]|uniref:Lipoprotein n=1 Tax=Candidatus Methylobacter oryzae TaxID=2497749 RepID=A0ABY3C8Z8_9GAMM|nr:hypothetical protein [Candidatus Methylobacter oryzae]TRW92893.1 hypothetical protein EKO24_014130 [Candidatus Methylobacter oryzae]